MVDGPRMMSREDAAVLHRQRAPVMVLHLIAVVLLGLQAYVRTLPPTPARAP